MTDVTYDLKDVTGKLGARIANLEIQLAHEKSAKEAYQKRVKELEKGVDQDESNNRKKK